DIKITGVHKQILTSALNQAREGRLHIVAEMAKAIEKPRADISKYAPKITTIRIPVSRIKDVIGPGGKVIKDIIARTGATIDIQDDGSVAIASPGRKRSRRKAAATASTRRRRRFRKHRPPGDQRLAASDAVPLIDLRLAFVSRIGLPPRPRPAQSRPAGRR